MESLPDNPVCPLPSRPAAQRPTLALPPAAPTWFPECRNILQSNPSVNGLILQPSPYLRPTIGATQGGTSCAGLTKSISIHLPRRSSLSRKGPRSCFARSSLTCSIILNSRFLPASSRRVGWEASPRHPIQHGNCNSRSDSHFESASRRRQDQIVMTTTITSLAARRERLLRFAQSPSPATIPTDPHLISEVRGFQMTSYALLQVRTRSGLVGYGECNELSGSDLNAANQALAGRVASSYQALDALVPPTVRGGLNIALLDILGKATQAPIYRLLGGPTRNKARAITRLSGASDEELQSDLKTQLAAGYRAFLVPIVPPAARRLQAMSSAAPEADFALGARAQLTPGGAATLAAAVERLHPLWFDEPCPVSNLETIRKISEETVVPLGFGRTISDPGTFQDLLRQGLVDLLRPDLLVHGICGVRRLSAMAETYYVAVAPWHEGGAIAHAAALHAAASMPNFFIAQAPLWGDGAVPKDGFFPLPTGPGLGIEVDEKTLEGNRIACIEENFFGRQR